MSIVRAHRLRSWLVIVGVAIGVSTLMGMVITLRSVGRQIEADIQSGDEPVVMVSKWDFLSGQNPETAANLPDLTPDDADAFAELPSVDIAEYYVDASDFSIIRYRDLETRPLGVVGVALDFPRLYTVPVEEGRYFTEPEIRSSRSVIVLGAGPADVLFPGGGGIGERVRVGPEEFEVVGILGKRTSLFGDLANAVAAIPWTAYEKTFGRSPEYTYIYLMPAEGYSLDQVADDARALLRTRRGLRSDADDDFSIISTSRIEELVGRVTGMIALVLVVLSSIGLLVGGIGVMNVMLISVTERTRELGLRKAVGARSRDILTQVLVESATLTGIGGLIGTLVSVLVAVLLTVAFGLPSGLSVGYLVVAVGFSASVGIVFGLYPAFRAARMDPIDALRHE
jgi:putative ABC transport system permease protein